MLLELSERVRQSPAHSPDRNIQRLCDLVVRVAMEVGQREDVAILLGHLGHRVADGVSLQGRDEAEPTPVHACLSCFVRREQAPRLGVGARAAPRVDGCPSGATDEPRSQSTGLVHRLRPVLVFWQLHVHALLQVRVRLHRLWKSG